MILKLEETFKRQQNILVKSMIKDRPLELEF